MGTHTRPSIQCIIMGFSFCLTTLSIVSVARGEFWFEDFTDGSSKDAGIEWTYNTDNGQEYSISSQGLLASTPTAIYGTGAVADLPADRPGWSIRTRGRLLQEHGFFGAGTRGGRIQDITWNVIASGGSATVGNPDHPYTTLVETDLRPFEEEVIVQLDTLDGVMRMWAWRDGEQPNEDIAPLIEEDFDLPAAAPYLWVRSDDGPSSALFSWVAISTDHMPVNMELPATDLIGDFSGNDILDVADVDLLAAAIRDNNVHSQFDVNRNGIVDLEDHAYWVSDLKHTWMGDANLDGNVNFADFVALANHFDGPGGWEQGDFDANGTVQFPDFQILANNYGATSTAVAVAVPEPCSGVLLMIGVLLRLVTRRAAVVR